MTERWYTLNVPQVEEKLRTGANGLTESEAKKRLEENGPNLLQEQKGKSAVLIFFEQFKDFMVLILLVAAIISAAVAHEYVDAIVIMILIIVNAVIGTVQEVKANKSMESLKNMSAPQAKVIRGGHQQVIPARDLVAGDVVALDTGDNIPADLRITVFANLKIQESALTGESVPVEKKEGVLGAETSLGDRSNMAFSSSLVTYGRGRGIVVATGMDTEVGHIAGLIQNTPQTATPMQKRLSSLGKLLGIAAIAICLVMFVTGVIYGKNIMEMFMTAISLAVAAIPEGLPAISTIVLAMGVQRMAKRNAIIRTLPSVETLGSATIICSDKTGTLTQNKMTVKRYALFDDRESAAADTLQDTLLLDAAVLCTDAIVDENGAIGDPTETALVELGISKNRLKPDLESAAPRVSELPFDSERKRMSTVHQLPDGKYQVYVKGGLDEVLTACNQARTGNGTRQLEPSDIEKLNEVNLTMASDALRVLAFAVKTIDSIPDDLQTLESELTYVGMVGMIDPPRPEAKAAVRECHEAGIIPVMITGDHKITASAIAKELDILQEDGRAITGKELENMSDDDLYREVEDISVYARVSPEHKVRIVEAWQKHGHVCAMTGDGVNDAPALKRADIGCSMGQVGTDVAKEASDLILVDDNFATVVAAVEEGRRIYDNVLKAVSFLLSCNIGEIITLFTATLFNWPTPLQPIHILLVNLVTDGLPALALGVDPAEPDIMKRQAKRQKGLFTRGMVWRICYQGLMVGVLTLSAFLLGMRHEAAVGQEMAVQIAQTMAFCVLAMSQIAHSFNIRSKAKSLFVVHPFQNLKLVGAGALSLAIVLACVTIPGLNTLLGLVPLTGEYFIEAALLSLAPILVVELIKLFKINTIKGE